MGIDQESVTADEKETDIRLRSADSKQQGTIELELGDERSGTTGARATMLMNSSSANSAKRSIAISCDRRRGGLQKRV
jgi:hypothetical protein